MTRRIALAILATVWATLIAGGLVAYLVTRAVQLRDLDQSIIRMSQALDDVSDRPEYRAAEKQPADAFIAIGSLDNSRPRPRLGDFHADILRLFAARCSSRREAGRDIACLKLEFRPPLRGGAPKPFGMGFPRITSMIS